MDVEGDFFLMCWREILLSSELYGETYIEERNIVLEPTVIYSVIIIIRIVKSGIRIGKPVFRQNIGTKHSGYFFLNIEFVTHAD